MYPLPNNAQNPLTSYTKKGEKRQQDAIQSLMADIQRRNSFLTEIYKKIEKRLPSTSTNEMDIYRGIKTHKDIEKALKIISYYTIEYYGYFILCCPKSLKPSQIRNKEGEIIKFSFDQFKWDLGASVGFNIKSASDHLLNIADLAKSRNKLNPRFDKWYRNPLSIKQNKISGEVLKKSGTVFFNICKFFGSTPVEILEMLFRDPMTAGMVPAIKDEFEERVIQALIVFCNDEIEKENK